MVQKKRFRLTTVVLLFAAVVLACPLCSLAAERVPSVSIPESAVRDIVPPASEISSNGIHSGGLSSASAGSGNMMLAASSNTVSGGCGITKVTSKTVTISGYSTCTASNPAITVALTIQCYYDGSWHSMATRARSATGTYVSVQQGYTVTSGYYYRTVGIHMLADGTATSSCTGALWVA